MFQRADCLARTECDVLLEDKELGQKTPARETIMLTQKHVKVVFSY